MTRHVPLLMFLVACGGLERDEAEEALVIGPCNPLVQAKRWRAPVRLAADQVPELATSGNGDAIAVWASPVGGRFDVYASRYAGFPFRTWSAPLVVADLVRSPSRPRVAMDGNGGAMFVWCVPTSGGACDLQAARMVNGVVGAIVTLDTVLTASHEAAVASAGNGDAMVAYLKASGGVASVGVKRFNALLGWGSRTLLEAHSRPARHLRLAGSPSGAAIVAWLEDDAAATRVFARPFVPGVGWEPEHEVAQLAFTDYVFLDGPLVAIDANAEALVGWATRDTGYANYFAEGARFAVNGTWTSFSLHHGTDFRAVTPSISIDDDGNGLAAFYSTSQGLTSSIVAQRITPAETADRDVVLAQ